MAARDELQKRIERKKAEIASLEAQVRDAKVYIQAMEDAIKVLPRELDDATIDTVLRPGSNVAKAREALQKAGKPMHILEILEAIGKETDPESRAALSGSLAAYVRKREIFTRPAPNTFGLLEFEDASPVRQTAAATPPPNFGLDEPQ